MHSPFARGTCSSVKNDAKDVRRRTLCAGWRVWRQSEAAGPRRRRRPRRSSRSRPAAAPAPARPLVDPVDALIATSQRAFRGRRAGVEGRPPRQGARRSSTAPSTCCSNAPYGARTDARLREHFDRLIDRINAYEVTALAQGDGFAEKRVRSGADRRAAEERDDLPGPGRRRGDQGGGQGRPRSTTRTTFRFPTTRRSCPTSKCSRDGCATTSRKASSAARSTCR